MWCMKLYEINPLHGCPGGLYRPTPQGYNSNLAGCRTWLSVSLIAGFYASCWGPPTGLVRSRHDASAASGSCRLLITIAVLLMMQAWSWGRGNSPAAWRAITVATPHLFLINGAWAPGEGSADSPSRLPMGPTGGSPAVS